MRRRFLWARPRLQKSFCQRRQPPLHSPGSEPARLHHGHCPTECNEVSGKLSGMSANRLKWMGFMGLLLMLAALGWLMIPAHLTSIWMDREYTDWISPIANRLHGGDRLYAAGMHS